MSSDSFPLFVHTYFPAFPVFLLFRSSPFPPQSSPRPLRQSIL